MMHSINEAVPIIGTVLILYVLLSKRVSTQCFEFGIFFNLSVVFWVLLFWADWTSQFVPVWQTTAARVLIMLMVLCIMKKAWRDTRKRPTNKTK